MKNMIGAIDNAIKTISESGEIERRNASNVTILACYEITDKTVTAEDITKAVNKRFDELGIDK